MKCSNIVVIEDDTSIREMLCLALESEGYSVVCFSDGKKALDGLRSVRDPCLILLDLMMPIMGGLEFLKERLKMGDVILAIPVIIVSATTERATNEKNISYQGILKKPVNVDILLQLVEDFCGRGNIAA
jgi:CheY-like chemotaxis protein